MKSFYMNYPKSLSTFISVTTQQRRVCWKTSQLYFTFNVKLSKLLALVLVDFDLKHVLGHHKSTFWKLFSDCSRNLKPRLSKMNQKKIRLLHIIVVVIFFKIHSSLAQDNLSYQPNLKWLCIFLWNSIRQMCIIFMRCWNSANTSLHFSRELREGRGRAVEECEEM